MKRSYRVSPARSAMKLLCTMLGLLLAMMAGFTVIFQQSIGKLPVPGLEPLPTLSQLGAASGESGSGSAAPMGGRGSDIINILLIGQDRSGEETVARSDSMILCTFNKHSRQLTMTSFLRDLYLEIPGHGSNRINAAYAFGGMELLDETLEHNFGLEIDGNVEVDFAQFSKIVDLLGGVEIELRADEAAHINQKTCSNLTEGLQMLNGDQALAYSRIRKLDADGDFARTNRQRKVMTALMETYKTAKLSTILSTINSLLPMINTDLNTLQIVKYAMELFPILSDIQMVSQRIPADGAYKNQTIDGMSVLTADLDAARELLEQTLTAN